MLLLLADSHFSLTAAILGILLLLVLSIPLGFLIALLLRRWHDRHPIEEAPNEKKPLGLE
jgi:NhaP-type Na+/H+ or K+/H+ antiporter